MKYITGTCWGAAILMLIGAEGGIKAGLMSFWEGVLWFLLVFVLLFLPFVIGYLRLCAKRILRKVLHK